MSTTSDGAEQMVRQCRNCGRLPAEDEVICEGCGFADFILGPAVPTPDAADTAVTGVGPMTQTADGAAPSATLKAVLIVFAVAVVVVLPALGLLFTLGQRSVLEEEAGG